MLASPLEEEAVDSLHSRRGDGEQQQKGVGSLIDRVTIADGDFVLEDQEATCSSRILDRKKTFLKTFLWLAICYTASDIIIKSTLLSFDKRARKSRALVVSSNLLNLFSILLFAVDDVATEKSVLSFAANAEWREIMWQCLFSTAPHTQHHSQKITMEHS